MKTIALYNSKGGVGKTSSAVNLAYLAAASGARTLLWDLDVQGSASFYFKVQPELKGGARKLLDGKAKRSKVVKHTEFTNLDLLPADESERNLDIMLDDMKKSRSRLASVLELVGKKYDYVFIDCPPGIGLIAENVFRATDVLLMPLIPTHLSLRSYEQVTSFIDDLSSRAPTLLCFFSMVDRRKRVHKDILAEYRSNPVFLSSYVPYASDVERMGERMKPVPVFARRSKAAQLLDQLWNEVEDRV